MKKLLCLFVLCLFVYSTVWAGPPPQEPGVNVKDSTSTVKTRTIQVPAKTINSDGSINLMPWVTSVATNTLTINRIIYVNKLELGDTNDFTGFPLSNNSIALSIDYGALGKTGICSYTINGNSVLIYTNANGQSYPITLQ